MSKAGKKLLGAAREAVEIAQGKRSPARVHVVQVIEEVDIYGLNFGDPLPPED